MSDESGWYVVRLKKGRPDAIWAESFGWLALEDWTSGKRWELRTQAKKAADKIRAHNKKPVRYMLYEDLRPWLVGIAIEDRPVEVGAFNKFGLPLIRRVYPALLAHQLVSVQPMTSAPVGFFTTPKFSKKRK